MLIQKVCNFCHTYYCRVSCTSSSLAVCDARILACRGKTPSEHGPVGIIFIRFSSHEFTLTCLAFLLLRSFALLPWMFMSHQRMAASYQVPSDTPPAIVVAALPFSLPAVTTHCSAESKAEPEGYRPRRWFPCGPAACAL